MASRVAAAVERALDARQREATEEVERILQAAVVVMERVAPARPRVSDIVEEAGTSNAAFYRYFSGKDDLILAVMERGVGLAASYIQHEMAKEPTPLAAVARWIEGALAQVSDPRLTSMSRAVMTHFTAHKENEISEPLHRLLLNQIVAAGCRNPELATDAVFAAVWGTLRKHVEAATQPTPAEVRYLTGFCLKAVDPDVPASKADAGRKPKSARRYNGKARART
ncbi:MAG: TetR/AcrR family transcriptional regulator [Mycobacterium sp.]